MHCSTTSVTVCLSVCSRSRMRRRAFWRELADATTSQQFFVLCFALDSGEAAGRLLTGHFRLQVAARSSSIVPGWRLPADRGLRTPQLRSAHANVLTVPRTNTRLGDRSFSVASPRIWNSLPASLRQPDIEFGHFKRLLKAFLFGETAAR